MIADMHVHSRFSDGSYSVVELAERSRSVGVSVLSVTDHDTPAGVAPAIEAGRQVGVVVIPGVEISAYDYAAERKIHILGYGFSPGATNIHTLCDPLLAARHRNTQRQIVAIADAGIAITEEKVRREAGPSPWLYKQHVMAVLIEKGYTDEIYSPLYRRLFKGTGVAAGDIEYVSYQDAMAAIVADGGIPVLAHPGQQGSLDLMPDLARRGLGGVELNHPDHRAADHEAIRRMAVEYGLLLTGGSDFHGRYGSSSDIGETVAPTEFFRGWSERQGLDSPMSV